MKERISFKPIMYTLLVLIIVTSCSKLENALTTPVNEQTKDPETEIPGNVVRYSISGNYSGSMDLNVILHNSMPINPLKINAIPWEDTFQVPDTSSFIGGYINAFYGNGQAEEEVNFKMFFKDRLIETVIRKANDEGNVNLPMEVLFFHTYDSTKTVSATNLGKTVRYEIETNFDKPFNVRYKVADGSWVNETLDNFPWSYSFTTEKYSTNAALYTYELIANELDGVMDLNDSITYRLFVDDIETKTAIISKIGPETFFSDGQIYHVFD